MSEFVTFGDMQMTYGSLGGLRMPRFVIRLATLVLLASACGSDRAGDTTVDEVEVIAANTVVRAGDIVTEGDLYAITMPAGQLPEGCFLSTEFVVGRRATATLLPHEPVRGARLSKAGNLKVALPADMRAMRIPITHQALLRYLEAGNSVDVLATTTTGDDSRTHTLLQAVTVLEIDPESPSVTLLVAPADAADLATAMSMGSLNLTLRNDPTPRPLPSAGAHRGNLASSAPSPRTQGDTDAQRVSTFAMDVASTSWNAVRSELRNHRLPRGERIRAEEFINRPTYRYPHPTGHEAFAAAIEGSPSPWTEGRVLVRVGLRAKNIDWSSRPPVHLTVVADTSGSMKGPRRLGLVRDTLLELAESLGPDDTVALVSYRDGGRMIIDHTVDRLEIQTAVLELSADDDAALHEALDVAYDLAQASFEPRADNRILLLTDGDAHLGRGDTGDTLRAISDHANRGIRLTGVGFGQGSFSDPTIKQLIDSGGGNYWYVDNPAEAKSILIDRTVGLDNAVASDAQVRVEWNPETVAEWSIVGYDTADDDRWYEDSLNAGEINSGHQVTALYELVLRPDGPVGAPLGQVKLSWQTPASKASMTRQFAVRASSIRDWDRIGKDFKLAVAEATFARKLRGERQTLALWTDIQTWVERDTSDAAAELSDLAGLARSASEQQCSLPAE